MLRNALEAQLDGSLPTAEVAAATAEPVLELDASEVAASFLSQVSAGSMCDAYW